MYAFYKKHEYLFAAFFVLITQLVVVPQTSVFYPDTDNYTHAQRLLDFLDSWTWAETPYMHTNYPYGEILHFTRITDVLWLLFSLPAFLFYPVKEAVFYGGFIFQTATMMLSAVALIWALRPVASTLPRLIGLCVFFIQPAVTETYVLIKPDHHALTALFAFVLTGSLIQYLVKKENKYLYIAGIAAGLGLWTSIEGLLISYFVLGSLFLLCLFGKETFYSCAVYFFCYFLSSFAFLAINPPFEGFFYPDNGRLSILLVTVIGLTAIAFLLLHWGEEKKLLTNFWKKASGTTLTALLFIGILFLIFPPSVVFQPFFPPAIKEIWANNVIELQPSLRNPVVFCLGCWPSLISLLIGLISFKFCTSQQRSVLILTLIPLIIFVGFSMASIRYARLSSLFTPFPLVLAFHLRLSRYTFSDKKKAVLIFLLYTAASAFLGINYLSLDNMLLRRNRPPLEEVKPYIPDGEGSILADTFLGPEIIWTLEESVIGAPYHRNVEGISDGFWMFSAPNIPDVINALKKHRVKAILLHLDVPENPDVFYNTALRSAFLLIPSENKSLYARLVRNKDLPCGIKEEPNVAAPYLLYTVDFSQCSEEKSDK